MAIAVGVALHYAGSGPGKSSAYKLGYSMGTAILPLLAAYFGSLVWKHRQAPGAIAAVVVLLSLGNAGKEQRAIERLTKIYVADLNKPVTAWQVGSDKASEWEPADFAVLTMLKEVSAKYNALLASSAEHYQEMLAAEDLEQSEITNAWQGLQRRPDFAKAAKVLAGTSEVVKLTMVYMSSLASTHGQWRMGEDSVMFDEDVDDRLIEELNKSVDGLVRAAEALEAVVEGR